MRSRLLVRSAPVALSVFLVGGCSEGSESATVAEGTVVPVSTELPTVREVPLPALPADAIPGIGRRAAVSPSGQIVFTAADSPDHDYRLLVVDSTGATIGRVGRAGAGPGELRSPMFVEFSSDTSIVVWDMGTARVTVFSPLGGVLASHHPGEAQVPKELVGDSLDFRDQRRADAPMVRQSVGGGRPRTLVRGTDPRVDSLFPVRRMEGATTRGFISYAAGGGRIAIGDGKRYAILVYDASGRFIGIAGRSLPVQVPTAEQAVAESLSMLNQPSISPARRASRMREYRERPVSYFREIRFDDHRRLWVFRPERDGVVADVYADTTLLGSIPLACPGFEPAGVGMRYGWVVLSCRNLDPDAPSDGTFRLFRVEG